MDKDTAVSITTSALGQLQLVGDYYANHRHQGHTTAMIEGARTTGALIIAADATHAATFTDHGLTAVTRSVFSPGMRGPQREPMVVDHWALQCMIHDARDRLAMVTRQIVDALDHGRIW